VRISAVLVDGDNGVRRLDAVYELLRCSVRRDDVKPAPADRRLRGDAQDAIGDRIPVVMIVKEPRIDGLLSQDSLNLL
jgi:hypothetical protein